MIVIVSVPFYKEGLTFYVTYRDTVHYTQYNTHYFNL